MYLRQYTFLVGAFSFKEKSPTITVSSFFSAYNLTLNGPLFNNLLFICSKLILSKSYSSRAVTSKLNDFCLSNQKNSRILNQNDHLNT